MADSLDEMKHDPEAPTGTTDSCVQLVWDIQKRLKDAIKLAPKSPKYKPALMKLYDAEGNVLEFLMEWNRQR